MIRSLYGRLALVFALLTLACGGFTAWLYQDMAARHQQEALQRLSRDLAGHIASHTDLVKELKWNRPAVEQLFNMLMVVNPGIEVYLIKANGHVDADELASLIPGHLTTQAELNEWEQLNT